MNKITSLPLNKEWKNLLGLNGRQSPELFLPEDTIANTPHAGVIRTAFNDLGLSALFCIEGVPTVAFVVSQTYDREAIKELHGALWNQGFASLLLVITDDVVRVFSLSKKPYKNIGDEFDNRYLVETLETVTQALRIQELITGTESGRYWKDNNEFFDADERIDQVLLGNLEAYHRLLCSEGLSSDQAQALLMQVMFIAYLEDRGITTKEYFETISNGETESFQDILNNKSIEVFIRLFEKLRNDFNGDLFVVPCSFEPEDSPPVITENHLGILGRFRAGRETIDEGGTQLRFWGYDFRYIPVELISAVYDRFLGEREAERRAMGAYYTPMFLADTVVSQVWDLLPEQTMSKGRFLDPACGSGIFLVRSFQRLCEYWRSTHSGKNIPWKSLISLLSRVHGWDLNGSAVRVTAFSLYVALLEEVAPPDIEQQRKKGKALPKLWGRTLKQQDFFHVNSDNETFEVLIGNPPWTSRKGVNRTSVKWSKENGFPMPSQEDAWAFTWKSLCHLAPKGLVAFLLPAMGFLHNHAKKTLEAREKLIGLCKFHRVINFSDLRFQLFDGAIRPTALLIFYKNDESNQPYKFDYWFPKADLNLNLKRHITLSVSDRTRLNSLSAADGLAFKKPLWMRSSDEKLFNYFSKFRKLEDFIQTYGYLKRRKQDYKSGWVIGHGFKPATPERLDDVSYDYVDSELISSTSYLPIEEFQKVYQNGDDLSPWKDGLVHRKGFEQAFKGCRVLVPRGIETSKMRLRAAYADKPLTFQDIIQAITLPAGSEREGKLLAAFLNSRLALWFAFHGTSSFGSDRPEVQQAELLRLPFPKACELPDTERANSAAQELIELVDKSTTISDKVLFTLSNTDSLLESVDRLVYEYFCLSGEEIFIIEDTIEMILPAIQPSKGAFPEIWKPSTRNERAQYAQTLAISLGAWFNEKVSINVSLEARSLDVAILKVSQGSSDYRFEYQEKSNANIQEVLQKLSEEINRPIGGNFQALPDFRIFIGNDLYLIKPTQKRFWLRSAALSDADAIAQDIQDSIELGGIE